MTSDDISNVQIENQLIEEITESQAEDHLEKGKSNQGNKKIKFSIMTAFGKFGFNLRN